VQVATAFGKPKGTPSHDSADEQFGPGEMLIVARLCAASVPSTWIATATRLSVKRSPRW
jgi:hypothetical protein